MLPPAPTPETLNWLAKGRLADRTLRSIRLWVLLQLMYTELPPLQSFRYGDVRDCLFAATHGRSDTASAPALSAECNQSCRCQQSFRTILENSPLPGSLAAWQQTMSEVTPLSAEEVECVLQQYPFMTVHRSIRDDLVYLAEMGWLTREKQGRFVLRSERYHPQMPQMQGMGTQAIEKAQPLSGLSIEEIWEVVRSLESIAFVNPHLEIIIQSLWEQIADYTRRRSPKALTDKTPTNTALAEPTKRIFIHLDYILSEAMQEQVDTLQEQIEQIWREGGGIVQFDYASSAMAQKKMAQKEKSQENAPSLLITVYPVCIHYARRAKYLSAYGIDPSGQFGWHNYRLDRITSTRLTLMDWQNSQVPSALKAMYEAGTLPTAETVSEALSQAWGFNFYLPRRLLIMRFPSDFAKRYVQDTERHPTFESIEYQAIPKLVRQVVVDGDEQAAILKTLDKKDKRDKYYRAWIRLGDINIVMRLRDWRPKGEVIAPVELRRLMHEEAQQEFQQYEE